MSDIMSYRVEQRVQNMMNAEFNTYREEVKEANKKKKTKETTRKQNKTPTNVKKTTRKIAQKENREVNTTDKAVKRKSATKLLHGHKPML